jgi:hypothetical protein
MDNHKLKQKYRDDEMDCRFEDKDSCCGRICLRCIITIAKEIKLEMETTTNVFNVSFSLLLLVLYCYCCLLLLFLSVTQTQQECQGK